MIKLDKRPFLHWLERLKVIRNLPQNTRFLFQSTETEKLLLELSSLPTTMDPINWLMTNDPDLISRVLLWKVLSVVGIIVESVRHNPDSSYLELGRALQSSIDMNTWKEELGSSWLISNETLQNRYRFLLDNIQINKIVSSDANDLYLSLFIEALRLPKASNPLVWIKSTYLDLAALFTIRLALSQSIPTSWTYWESLTHTKYLNKNYSTKGFKLKLTQLHYGDVGFTFDIEISIPGKLKRKLGQGSDVRWDSIERINDDLGNSYLICSRKLKGGTATPWQGATYSLRLYCFPSILPDAKRLQICFTDPSVSVQKFLDDHLAPASKLRLEDFMLTIDLTE